MNSWVCKFFFALVCSLFTVSVFSNPVKWALPQGAEQEYLKSIDDEFHQVLLSSPKRINNTLTIESDRKLTGTKQNLLVRVNGAGTSKDAFMYYRDLVLDSGEVLYKCEERACGSSNYWANTILNERKLYGRDSEQYYLAGTVTSDGAEYWVSIYAVKNGRKQHYLLLTSIKVAPTKQSEVLHGLVLDSPILTSGQVDILKDQLAANPQFVVLLTSLMAPDIGTSKSKVMKELEMAVSGFAKTLSDKYAINSERIKTNVVLGSVPTTSNDVAKIYYQLHLLNP